MHEVSNEFRALPTLHKEGRAANAEEQADPKARSEISSHYEDGQPRTAGALNRRQWKAGLADKLQTKYRDDRELQVAKIERRLEKERTKSLIGRKLQEENQRLLKQGTREVMPASVKAASQYDSTGPRSP